MSIAELAAPLHDSSGRRAGDRRERRLRGVRPLVGDGGCDVRLRGGRHVDLVRAALLEWLPLSPAELARDGGGAIEERSSCLASLVRPPTIWTLEDAVALALLLGREGPLERVPFAWLVRHARGRVEGVHLSRVRRRAARIAAQLPLSGLPCASAAVGAACALIQADDEVCASIAALALARYSLSQVVSREAEVLRLP
jgi:hypothetical protein